LVRKSRRRGKKRREGGERERERKSWVVESVFNAGFNVALPKWEPSGYQCNKPMLHFSSSGM
jgi:hypothetical protein